MGRERCGAGFARRRFVGVEHFTQLGLVHCRICEQRQAKASSSLRSDRRGDADVDGDRWVGGAAGFSQEWKHLVHELSAVFATHAEPVELRVAVAERDPERQAALGKPADCGRVLRDLLHRVHRQQHHRSTDPELFCSSEDRARHSEVGRAVSVEPEMVLREPDRIETERFGELRVLEHVPVELDVVVRSLWNRLHAEDAEPDPQRLQARMPSSNAASAASWVPLPTDL